MDLIGEFVKVDSIQEFVESHLDIPTLIQAYFIYASIGILIGANVPALQSRFFDYGARAQTESASPSKPDGASNPKPESKETASPFSHFLDILATITVPHGWFTHFYILSTLSSLFWLSQILHTGGAIRFLQSHTHLSPPSSSSSSSPLTPLPFLLAWFLMFLQGTRRLTECLLYPGSPTSCMWFAHYLVGLFFYLLIGPALLVRRIDLIATGVVATTLSSLIQSPLPALRSLLTAEDAITRTLLPTLLFLAASVAQHAAHAHLAALRRMPCDPASPSRYRVPAHPLFARTLTPHYLAEVFIYLALARLTAGPGEIVDPVVLAGAAFVTVNLGVTAARTGRWYREKFGEKVRGRANMVPFVW